MPRGPATASKADPAADGPGAFRLSEFLPYQLAVLAEVTSAGFAQVYRERFRLTIPEWRVLATIAEAPRVRAKDVVAARHLPKTAVSRAVASLRRRGLLKVDVNAHDKRESFLSLTPRGRALHAEIVPYAAAFAEAMLGRLTPAERAAFQSALRKLGAIATPGDRAS
ncbi:MAG: MarR family winged helix-turn-helix transcriptional regulator [Hyphomicrobiaceae bacterium]|nr:MarR family winged helix-turn-helix transcriptional regulator [Hyphomicrobiaceae bacterium]